MTIHKAKSSDYNTVNTENIMEYIREYSYVINRKISNMASSDGHIYNRTVLKQIAAELETVKKRIEYMTEGRY